MTDFNREEIQKRDHDRSRRRNIFNDLKKKKMISVVKIRSF